MVSQRRKSIFSSALWPLNLAYDCEIRKRQYKRRIEKWGLDKNVKGNEMMAIAVQQAKRKLDAGKDSSFRI
jgi:hypothetical protein